jgi:MoaA/NifB/PqqE/SkfB family radical SAM enzyme
VNDDNMNAIIPKEHHNYVAYFLTLACNLACPYCINRHDAAHAQATRSYMSADDWIAAANRLVLRPDLPLTLQGGEPTLYPGFYRFVNEVQPEIKMDLMTNLMFDVDAFIQNVPVWRFTREAPYAAIRVSYHPGQNDIDDLIAKTLKLQEAGFRIGLYGIEPPDNNKRSHILAVQERCLKIGLDFRLKEFLGRHDGVMYGTFKYPDCVNGEVLRSCSCRTTEIIVDPAGYVYKCHADLYNARKPIAHILDEDFSADLIDDFRDCHDFGSCNPCDVKVKTNRFQVFGHTSVDIVDIR